MTYNTSRIFKFTIPIALVIIIIFGFEYHCHNITDLQFIRVAFCCIMWIAFVCGLENHCSAKCSLKVVAHIVYQSDCTPERYTRYSGGRHNRRVAECMHSEWRTKYLYEVNGQVYEYWKEYNINKDLFYYDETRQVLDQTYNEIDGPLEYLTLMVNPRNPKDFYELPVRYQITHQFEENRAYTREECIQRDGFWVPDEYDY